MASASSKEPSTAEAFPLTHQQPQPQPQGAEPYQQPQQYETQPYHQNQAQGPQPHGAQAYQPQPYPYGSQPYQQQPQPYGTPSYQQQPQGPYGGTDVIFTTQLGSSSPHGLPQNVRPWSSSLWSCFDDCGDCMFAHCCFPCYLCNLATEMNESALSAFCLGAMFLAALRTKLRTQYGILGDIDNDIDCACFCGCCVAIQMRRELQYQRAMYITRE